MRQIFRYDPAIGWRFIPNITARIPHSGGGYLLRTNHLGFRCDHDGDPDGDAPQVLLFGDSFTAGDGVSNGKRYGDVAESRLGGIEIRNFAIPGIGPDQQYLTWRTAAVGCRADVVVVAIWVENIRRVVSRMRWFEDQSGGEKLFAKPWFELRNGELELRGAPPPARPVAATLSSDDRAYIAQRARLPWARPIVERVRGHRLFADLDLQHRVVEPALRATRYQPVPEYADRDGAPWKLVNAIVSQWSSEVAAPVIIVPLPFHHHVLGIADPTDYQARFRELSTSSGATSFDPLEALQTLDRTDRRKLYFATDGHPTALWHQIVGEALTPVLSAQVVAARQTIEGAR